MVSKADRSAIIANLNGGMPISTIAMAFKLHQEQLLRVVKRFKETGCIEHRPRSGIPQTTRSQRSESWLRRRSIEIHKEALGNWPRSTTSAVNLCSDKETSGKALSH